MTERNYDLEESLPTEKVWHPVRLDSVEEKPASPGKEHDQFFLTMIITEGEDVGMYIWDYVSQGAKSAWRVRQYYEACGLPVPTRGSTWDAEVDLPNHEFELKGELETYEGRERFKIREMRPRVIGSGTEAAQAAPAAGPTDDDIPF